MKKLSILCILFIYCGLISAQLDSGYEIRVELTDYNKDTILLGQHFGNQQYLKDTAVRADDGSFTFLGDEDLPGGVYLIVLKPDNNFIQLLINSGERNISLKATNGKIPEITEISGSDDNMLFKNYVSYIQEKTPVAAKLREQIQAKKEANEDASAHEKELEIINNQVKANQTKVFNEHPKSLTTLLIKGTLNPTIPTFEGSPQEIEQKRFRYFRKHYFDNIDMKDPRILRTPFLFNRIDQLIERYTPKVPDSINQTLDLIFEKLEGNDETSKFYLIHYLNHFAKSEFVGMDAIYVHLVDNYYAKGKADWLEKKQLDKIVDNARRLRPLLIGQKAPDLKMRLQDESFVSIYETECEYMILFFWSPDCPHCQKQMPDMIDFYDTYKDQDIKIFSICSKLNTTKEPDGGSQCWEYIETKPEMKEWIQVADPYHLTKYKILYDLKTTPQIFVLDKNKTIRSKRIGADQLKDVMEHLYLQDGKKMEEEKAPGKE